MFDELVYPLLTRYDTLESVSSMYEYYCVILKGPYPLSVYFAKDFGKVTYYRISGSIVPRMHALVDVLLSQVVGRSDVEDLLNPQYISSVSKNRNLMHSK